MPLWQWLLDAAGLLLVLVLLYGGLLVLRRRVLSRHGGTFELSHRTADGHAGQRLGARPRPLLRRQPRVVPDLLAVAVAQARLGPVADVLRRPPRRRRG